MLSVIIILLHIILIIIQSHTGYIYIYLFKVMIINYRQINGLFFEWTWCHELLNSFLSNDLPLFLVPAHEFL